MESPKGSLGSIDVPVIDNGLEDDLASPISSEKSLIDFASKAFNFPSNQKPKTDAEIREKLSNLRRKVNSKSNEDIIFGYPGIREAMLEAFLNKDLDTSLRVRAVLLAGLPGTGKTSNIRSCAVNISTYIKEELSVYTVTPGHLLDMYSGQAEKAIQILYEIAAAEAPTVIILDEADALMRKRSSTEAEHNRSFKNQLLQSMQEVSDLREKHVLTLCASNKPWDIDQAFLRRFSDIFCVHPPTVGERVQIFMKFVNKMKLVVPCSLDENDFENFKEATEGFTGDDIRRWISKAANKASRIEFQGQLYKISEESIIKERVAESTEPVKTVYIPVKHNDLAEALTLVSKSYTVKDFKEFEKWVEESQKIRSTDERSSGSTKLVAKNKTPQTSNDDCCSTVFDRWIDLLCCPQYFNNC